MPEIVREEGEPEEAFDTRLLEVLKSHWSTCAVKVLAGAKLQNPGYWATVVSRCRRESLDAATANWERMIEVLGKQRPLEKILREVYRIDADCIHVADQAHPFKIMPPARLCDRLGAPLQQALQKDSKLLVIYPGDGDWQRLVMETAQADSPAYGMRECALPASLTLLSHRDAPNSCTAQPRNASSGCGTPRP